MAEDTKSVVIENLESISPIETVKAIAIMGQDIKHIKSSVDELKERSSKQDEIISQLRQNCNREERWSNLFTDVRILKTQVADILSAKCPKSGHFTELEESIKSVSDSVRELSELVNGHITSHKASEIATKPYREVLIQIGLIIVGVVSGLVIAAIWMKVGLPA